MSHQRIVGPSMCVFVLVAGALWTGADAGEDSKCAKGDDLRRSGSMQDALDAYRACVAGGGGDAVTRHNLGIALLNIQEFSQAQYVLESAVALQPMLAASYAGIGQALEGMHRCCEAASYHRKAIAISCMLWQNADPFRHLLLLALLKCPDALHDAQPRMHHEVESRSFFLPQHDNHMPHFHMHTHTHQ